MRLFLITTFAIIFGLSVAGALGANAEVVTFTGTVSYNGTHTGDTLFVAVIDTTQEGEDVTFLDLEAYFVNGASPINQPYSLTFDNATAPATAIVAALLDPDGGGVDTVGGADIIGWYASEPEPTGVTTATSHSGLDFDLPEAEIHGAVVFAPGQEYANILAASSCTESSGFGRPSFEVTSSGAYEIIGLYAGTYCVFGFGFVPPFTFVAACYGDPTCANPTLITLTAEEVRNGINLDFTGNVPASNTTWGLLKSRYK